MFTVKCIYSKFSSLFFKF